MNEINKTFRFNIGRFECRVIRDTISPMELDLLFATTPREKVREWLRKHNIRAGEVMDIMCLLIRTAERIILVDTGWGITLTPDEGKLMENLQLIGVQRGEIDSIVISHGHPDHIGGITDENNSLCFPNARYYMLKKEWEFWMSGPDLSGIAESIAREISTYTRKNLPPIKDRIVLAESDTEVLPGIKYINAAGHTPGQGLLIISSEGKQLLYSADLFHHPLQVARPELCMSMDLAPKQGFKTRTEIIKWVVAANMPVFACHFPFPGIGHLVPQDDTFVFQPIAKSI